MLDEALRETACVNPSPSKLTMMPEMLESIKSIKNSIIFETTVSGVSIIKDGSASASRTYNGTVAASSFV